MNQNLKLNDFNKKDILFLGFRVSLGLGLERKNIPASVQKKVFIGKILSSVQKKVFCQ